MTLDRTINIYIVGSFRFLGRRRRNHFGCVWQAIWMSAANFQRTRALGVLGVDVIMRRFIKISISVGKYQKLMNSHISGVKWFFKLKVFNSCQTKPEANKFMKSFWLHASLISNTPAPPSTTISPNSSSQLVLGTHWNPWLACSIQLVVLLSSI